MFLPCLSITGLGGNTTAAGFFGGTLIFFRGFQFRPFYTSSAVLIKPFQLVKVGGAVKLPPHRNPLTLQWEGKDPRPPRLA